MPIADSSNDPRWPNQTYYERRWPSPGDFEGGPPSSDQLLSARQALPPRRRRRKSSEPTPAPTSTTPMMTGARIDAPVDARPPVFFGCGAGGASVRVGLGGPGSVGLGVVGGGAVSVVLVVGGEVGAGAAAQLPPADTLILLSSAFATISDCVLWCSLESLPTNRRSAS